MSAWINDPAIRPVSKLLEYFRNNHVYFERTRHMNGAGARYILHVHCAVAVVRYMSGQLQELYEEYQILPNGKRIERHLTFNGLAETLNHNGVPELTDEACHRLLVEELGQTQPLFKEQVGYQLFHLKDELMGPMLNDKWPVLCIFHRSEWESQIPHGSPLYIPSGYKETKKDGTVIKFSWKDI